MTSCVLFIGQAIAICPFSTRHPMDRAGWKYISMIFSSFLCKRQSVDNQFGLPIVDRLLFATQIRYFLQTHIFLKIMILQFQCDYETTQCGYRQHCLAQHKNELFCQLTVSGSIPYYMENKCFPCLALITQYMTHQMYE